MSCVGTRRYTNPRTLPEYWAAIMTALKINETAKAIASWFLSIKLIQPPPKHVKGLLQREHYSKKWAKLPSGGSAV